MGKQAGDKKCVKSKDNRARYSSVPHQYLISWHPLKVEY